MPCLLQSDETKSYSRMIYLKITGLKDLHKEVKAIVELEEEGYFSKEESKDLIRKSKRCLSTTSLRL